MLKSADILSFVAVLRADGINIQNVFIHCNTICILISTCIRNVMKNIVIYFYMACFGSDRVRLIGLVDG